LAIAADGRNSTLRKAAGISVKTHRYGQKALAFAVTHDAPHDNISTEVHRTGGPFTLVPLPDFEGKPSSAIVWMDDGPAQVTRQAMPEDDFNRVITDRSAGVAGTLTLASRRTIWPIISQHANSLTARRLALIAEAAHVVPPIGAQGLNMSLRDTATLLELSNTHSLGSAHMLDAFEAARKPDIRLRVAGIDLLNRASQISSPLLREARYLGLEALYAAPPVRRLLMEMGLGTKSLSKEPGPQPA
jgi:2-octaprenyl-6-methoxyphenol hydroxylase